MKQSISPLDWQNLEKTNKEVADKLEEYYTTWQKEQEKEYPNSHLIFDHISKWLTIGRMIEILEGKKWKKNLVITKSQVQKILIPPGRGGPDKLPPLWYCADLNKGIVRDGYGAKELCDALWVAVKNILESRE